MGKKRKLCFTLAPPWSGLKPHEQRPVDCSYASPFGHPFSLSEFDQNLGLLPLYTIDERAMIDLSWEIRQKPEWWIKYKNPKIVAKWKEESKNQIRECLFNYIIDELELYERYMNETGNSFYPGPNQFVYVGDNVVSEDLKQKFKREALKLEDVPESAKDWHPGSNNRVLDLVHPSLYPLQYKVTRIVKDLENDHVGLSTTYSGEIRVMPRFNEDEDLIKGSVSDWAISKKFQWLPSVFTLKKTSEGQKVTIDSYINNLHPVKNHSLYQPIADIFALFVPAINRVLTEYASGARERLDYSFGYYEKPEEIKKAEEEDADNYDDLYAEWESTRMPTLLEPIFNFPYEENIYHIDVSNSRLKVIVKMANIELTPERPDYPGGSWHVEGSINEDIVCTCLYYYDCENITFSELRFRAAVMDPPYEQHDEQGVQILYGIENDENISMRLGEVECKEDRMIVFPNMLQHYVAPFELKDKTKPGHRKILCFFIVDPYNDKVITTDQVPPQQQSWWSEKIFGTDVKDSKKTSKKSYTRFNKLPPEIICHIQEEVDWPISLNKAKKVRAKLMKERSYTSSENSNDDNIFTRTFNLCEH